MSKLNKYANLYDKDGNLLRHIDEKTGKLEDYTIEELEKLVDELANDKDENGKVKDPMALNNANWVLTQYYHKYGVPNFEEIIEEWKKQQEQKSINEQIEQKLQEVADELGSNQVDLESDIEDPNEIVSQVETNLDPEYVEFEQIEKNELYDQLNSAA